MPFIFNEPSDAYHDSGSYGIHSLLTLEGNGPEAFRLRCVTKQLAGPRRKSYDIGTLAHLLILEGENAYEQRIAIQPRTYQGKESAKKDAPLVEKPWNANATACQEWTAEREAAGKLVISAEDDAMLRAMRRAVHDHPDAAPLLRCGRPEVTVRQSENGVPIQCRPDWMTGGPTTLEWTHRVELKTCDSLDGFTRDAFNYHYDRQCAFYDWMLAQEGVVVPTVLVVVEKQAPHRVGCWSFGPDALERAHRLNERLLDHAADILAANPDPTVAWPRGDKRLTVLELPTYLREEWQQARAAMAGI